MRLQHKNKKVFVPHSRIHGGRIKNIKKTASNIAELTKQFNNITGKKVKKFTLKL
jgi:hypothetical protein